MADEFRTYLVAQLPGWTVTAAVAGAAYRWEFIAPWLALIVIALWIAKDLLLFPMMRRFYCSEPSDRRMVGQRGTAITEITSSGFVRVQGELWQAQGDRYINRRRPRSRVRHRRAAAASDT